MAARWLGDGISDALGGDAGVLDLLIPRHNAPAPAVIVRRQSAVSHRVMMLQQERANTERQLALVQWDEAEADA